MSFSLSQVLTSRSAGIFFDFAILFSFGMISLSAAMRCFFVLMLMSKSASGILIPIVALIVGIEEIHKFVERSKFRQRFRFIFSHYAPDVHFCLARFLADGSLYRIRAWVAIDL